MLKHPTLNLLQQLGLAGMAEAFARLADNEDSENLSHAFVACVLCSAPV